MLAYCGGFAARLAQASHIGYEAWATRSLSVRSVISSLISGCSDMQRVKITRSHHPPECLLFMLTPADKAWNPFKRHLQLSATQHAPDEWLRNCSLQLPENQAGRTIGRTWPHTFGQGQQSLLCTHYRYIAIKTTKASQQARRPLRQLPHVTDIGSLAWWMPT